MYFYGSEEPFTYHHGDFSYTAEFRGIGPWLQGMLQDDEAGGREAVERLFTVRDCPACGGSRLRPESRAVKVHGMGIADLTRLPVKDALAAFSVISLNEREELVAGQVLNEIRNRLEFLLNVGVGYLSLDRSVTSLSGGEGQRIRLATQIGSQVAGRALCSR